MNSATINTKALRSVLSVCEKTTRRTPHPALRNVAISLNGSAIILWTDKEQTLAVSIPCDHTGEDFSVLLNGCALFDAVKSDRYGKTAIDATGRIECEGTAQTIGHIDECDAIDRPLSPNLAGDQIRSERVKIADFSASVSKVIFATDQDACRYALGAIKLEGTERSLRMVATDSRRLIVAECPRIPTPGTPFGEFEALLPVSFAENLLKLLPKTGEMTISENRHEILVTWINGTYRCRMMEGRFPRYADILPNLQECGYRLSFNAGEALAQLKTLLPHVTYDRRGADFSFSYGSGKAVVKFATESGDILERKFNINGLRACADMTVSFNVKYFVEYLEQLAKRSSVEWYLKNNADACRMISENTDHVLMPLHPDR